MAKEYESGVVAVDPRGSNLVSKVSQIEDACNRLDEAIDGMRKRLDHLTVYRDSAKAPGLSQDRSEMSETIKRLDDIEDSISRATQRLHETLEALQA